LIEKMAQDQTEPPVMYKLEVQKTIIECSKSLISHSSLIMDLLEFSTDDDSPIPIPNFITRQIILDWIEIVEKEDFDCAHLVLVSLSYLLDFLIAMDFLGCERVKESVEEKIKEKINEDSWREVLSYTKDILGLDKTTKNALEHIMKQLSKYYTDTNDFYPAIKDPWADDYCRMSTSTLKMMLQSEVGTNEQLKMHLINKWVVSNSLENIPSGVYDLLRCLELKELSDIQIKSITDQVNSWPLSEEQFHMFSETVCEAKKERDEIQEAKRFKPGKKHSLRSRRIYLNGGLVINAGMVLAAGGGNHFPAFADLYDAMHGAENIDEDAFDDLFLERVDEILNNDNNFNLEWEADLQDL